MSDTKIEIIERNDRGSNEDENQVQTQDLLEEKEVDPGLSSKSDLTIQITPKTYNVTTETQPHPNHSTINQNIPTTRIDQNDHLLNIGSSRRPRSRFSRAFYRKFRKLYRFLMVVFPPVQAVEKISKWSSRTSSIIEDYAPWTQVLKDLFIVFYLIVWFTLVPLGIVAYYLDWNSKTVFILNFFGVICLTWLLDFAIETLGFRYRKTMRVLLRISSENIVRLIIGIFLLIDDYTRIVQAHLLGAIIGNILVVTGFYMLIGGIAQSHRTYQVKVAKTSSSMLGLAALSLILPAGFHLTSPEDTEEAVLLLSRVIAFVLLGLYALYVVFKFRTHSYLFNAENNRQVVPGDNRSTSQLVPLARVNTGASERPVMQLPVYFHIIFIVVTVVLLSFNLRFLVFSIHELKNEFKFSQTFIGLIVLPLIELFGFIPMALDDMDFIIGVAIGSSMQVILFVTPVLILVGWIISKPLSLFFQLFETCVLFMSVLIINYVLLDGTAHWLEGAMLLTTYLLIAISFALYPTT